MKPSLLALTGLAAMTALAALPSTAADAPPAYSAVQAPVPPEVPVALLVDLSSGRTLYARAPDARFVPASVTKVMSAYTAFKLIDAGKLSPDTMVQVSDEVGKKWGGEGSSMFLKAGDRVTVGQLLLGITTVSGNDAAVMLAMSAAGSMDKWLALMNANAAELGMRNTHFGTPNGWMDEGHTYTSARDLVLLADAMTTRYPDLYHRYFGHRRMAYQNVQQVNHEPVSGIVHGGDGIKTGYTRQAGYNVLGSAERDGRRLVVVIAGAPMGRVRNQAARDLLEWGFAAFQAVELVPQEAVVGQARVQGGADLHVPLRAARAVMTGGDATPTLTLRYRGPVEAPVSEGQSVGMLQISEPGQTPHEVPLVAAKAVPRANWLQRLRNGLIGLFV